MGGGSDPVQPTPPPAPPSTGETSAEAIQAQIDALPKQLAAQKEYGPQFSELELQQLQEFGPQFAEQALELQKEYAPQFAEVERELSPELAGAQDTLANFFQQTDDAEYQALKPGFVEDVRSAHSQRGLGDISPLGSIDEGVQLQRLKQSLKDRRLNMALSTAGRVPISGVPTMQGQTGVGQLVQNVDPNSIFNYQSSLNNFNSSIFGTQANMYGTNVNAVTQRRGQNMSMISDISGAAMMAAGTAVGGALSGGAGCWVASEIFGGWEVPDTQYARFYINARGPEWFRKFYNKFGERFAAFIKNKPFIKKLLRPLFIKFSNIGRRCLNG